MDGMEIAKVSVCIDADVGSETIFDQWRFKRGTIRGAVCKKGLAV